MKAYIKAISYYLPSNSFSNEDINKEHPEWAIEKIMSKTGIKNRYICSEDEFASDMAIKVSNKLFKEYEISPDSVDFILYCTQSPDYFLPTTACILQDKLCISKNAGALDFNLGCSGYVYGLALAKGLLYAGVAKNILLITSETYSKFINPNDKSNKTIFGDGASASLISTNGFAEINNFSLGTDGKGANNLIVKEGGIRFPKNTNIAGLDSNNNLVNPSCLFMNGPEIFAFTSSAVPELIKEILIKNDTSLNSIDLFIFHQANKFMLEHLRKKIGISEDKFYYYLENCGNTVSSTIPIALKEAINSKAIKNNTKVLLAGFGVGYSWGGVTLKF
jgi:3-oxoacyl-[acyl-carrier-protein] synthase-3